MMASHYRRSIRLKGYDYSAPGAYFVTMLVKQRSCILSNVHDGEITLLTLGEIVNRCWHEIPKRFPSVELDAFVIMPNHLHGIIVITGNNTRAGTVRATLAVASAREKAGASPAPTRNIARDGCPKATLGDIVGAFKSLCFTTWYDHIKQNNLNIVAKFWHRNYYEHIIRNEREWNRIREYIAANPYRWNNDRENPNDNRVTDVWIPHERIWFSKSNLRLSHA